MNHLQSIADRRGMAAPILWIAFLFLSVISTFVSNPARSQSAPDQLLQVLLVPGVGNTLTDDVVNYFKDPLRDPKSPPVAALAIEGPISASYLLPIRASGDFLTYLNNNPQMDRSKLERYVIVRYPPAANLETALSALLADSQVVAASRVQSGQMSSAQLQSFTVESYDANATNVGNQYGREALNIDAAWQVAGGYALVGVIDSGLYTNHPQHRQFSSTGQYAGGNFIPASSVEVGYATEVVNGIPNVLRFDVDEKSEIPLPPANNWCVQNLPTLPPRTVTLAGHGTHTSGLIASNGVAGSSPRGTCKHCGIGMWKVSYWYCDYPGTSFDMNLNYPAAAASLALLSDTGAQVANLSFRVGNQNRHFCAQEENLNNPWCKPNICSLIPDDAWCLAISHANNRGVAVVAASGNDRWRLDFPASDERVVAAGGFNSSLQIWDKSPGSTTNCPAGPYPQAQCGSNYTYDAGYPLQEVMASADAVVSTTYPNMNWNPGFQCGDQYPGPGWGNGAGLCTGTSMSSPQIAGVVGLLRSVNPLVLPGKPNPNLGGGEVRGVRSVLASSTYERQSNPSYWSPLFGYGRPDAATAAKAMLGVVAGVQVKNRVTPLFRFYSTAANDYGDSTSPQMAMAYIISQSQQYAPSGQAIPGYSSFPPPPAGTTALPQPKANVYVLTTEYTPQAGYPALVPLHLMDRSRPFPAGCTPGNQGCNGNNRDLMLVTTTTDIEAAHAQGYDLRTIQGYIYAPCVLLEPTCIPPGAQRLYRKCKTSVDDCAVFLEFERSGFESQGYTAAYPSGSNMILGYAYPPTDSDGDGLVDGMEYVIGSNPNSPPGALDATYYPLAGVPTGDPCSGAAAAGCIDKIFKNGFQ